MSENWTCPVCGCGSRHYSARYMRDVCDQCGRPIRDVVAEQQRQSLDRTVAHAKDHLRVGNWDTCIALIEPLCGNAPADERLYLIMLAAITKGYTDFLLSDAQNVARAKATVYWEKLNNLGIVNGAMQRYAAARRAEIQRLRAKQWYRIAGLLFCIGLCLIIAGAASSLWSFLFFFGAIGFGWLLVAKCKFASVIKKVPQTGNPFKQ